MTLKTVSVFGKCRSNRSQVLRQNEGW